MALVRIGLWLGILGALFLMLGMVQERAVSSVMGAIRGGR